MAGEGVDVGAGLDRAFWHTYKSALYPLTFTDRGSDLSFPNDRVSGIMPSLVQLASMAVVRRYNVSRAVSDEEEEARKEGERGVGVEEEEDEASSASGEDLTSPNEEMTLSMSHALSGRTTAVAAAVSPAAPAAAMSSSAVTAAVSPAAVATAAAGTAAGTMSAAVVVSESCNGAVNTAGAASAVVTSEMSVAVAKLAEVAPETPTGAAEVAIGTSTTSNAAVNTAVVVSNSVAAAAKTAVALSLAAAALTAAAVSLAVDVGASEADIALVRAAAATITSTKYEFEEANGRNYANTAADTAGPTAADSAGPTAAEACSVPVETGLKLAAAGRVPAETGFLSALTSFLPVQTGTVPPANGSRTGSVPATTDAEFAVSNSEHSSTSFSPAQSGSTLVSDGSRSLVTITISAETGYTPSVTVSKLPVTGSRHTVTGSPHTGSDSNLTGSTSALTGSTPALTDSTPAASDPTPAVASSKDLENFRLVPTAGGPVGVRTGTGPRQESPASRRYLLHRDLALPINLCHALMTAALTLFKDDIVERLMSQWPQDKFVLSRYVPAMFDSVNPLYSDLDLCMDMRRGVKYTTCLSHSFMICIKRRSEACKLRYLDMTGFPTAEITLSYLASHVLLVSNEEKQRGIINMYNRLTRDLSLDLQLRDSVPSTFPDSNYVVCVDGLLETETAHLELCRALHAANNMTSPLTLAVRRLDVSRLGVVRIIVLLELLKPQYVTAASFQLNTFVNSALVVLLPALQTFSHLSSLDLSTNSMSMVNPLSDSAQSLTAILVQLPSLRRLNLSNNRLSGCLEKLLSDIKGSLSMLRLSDCSLLPGDISYLSLSHHAATLEELDLSATASLHSTSGAALHTLIQRASLNLHILELRHTDITVCNLASIFANCYTLRQLRYVDITNTASPLVDDIISLVPYLSAQRRLQAVRLPYPSDVTIGPPAQCDPTLLTEVRMAFQVLTRKLIRQLHESSEEEAWRQPYRLVFT